MTKNEEVKLINKLIKFIREQKKCVLDSIDFGAMHESDARYYENGLKKGFELSISVLRDELSAVRGEEIF